LVRYRVNLKTAFWAFLAIFPWIVVFSVVFFDLPPLITLPSNELLLVLFVCIILVVISIAYTFHAWKNKRTDWAIILFFFSFFAFPIYWWLYIKKEHLKLYESSSSFDKKMILPFLIRLSNAIDSGFNLKKVEKLAEFTFKVALDDQKQTEFYITHQNQKVKMIFSVFADDIDSYAIYIFTSKQVSELIDQEMEALFEELDL